MSFQYAKSARQLIVTLMLLLGSVTISYANIYGTSPTAFTPASQSPSPFVNAKRTAHFNRVSGNNSHASTNSNYNGHYHNNYNGNNYNRNNYNNNGYNRGRNYQNYQGYVVGVPVYYGTTVVVPANDDGEVVESQSVPTRAWVSASGGQVPGNAVVYTANGEDDGIRDSQGTMYYCRASYNGQLYEGVLVAGEGCSVEDSGQGATLVLRNYQVLVDN